jgi:uncharacterized membrane protein
MPARDEQRTRNSEEDGLTTQRIEAFSDGVFAIAITLLILEIHVPDNFGHPGQPDNLLAGLLSLWPSYFAYVVSFVVIGIFWANHHYVFNLYKKTDHIFNLLNVLFLMCISFLPLPTAVLGKHMEDATNRQTAVEFYALGMLLPVVAWLLCWLYARSGYRLMDPRLDEEFVHSQTRLYILSNLLYLGAFLLAFWNAYASLALIVGLAILYMTPPRPPVYRKQSD